MTVIFSLLLGTIQLAAAESPWTAIPPSQWRGALDAQIPALKGRAAAAVAMPAKEARPLEAASAAAEPPGLYEVRVTVRPSHAGDAAAFNAGLRVMLGNALAAEFPGQFFARPHQPETRTLQVVQRKAGPLDLGLETFADAKVVEAAWIAATLKKGQLNLGAPGDLTQRTTDSSLPLDLVLTPERSVYYVVDKIEYRPLSRSGRVARVEIDKIRYRPGETLKGAAQLADIGGRGGAGTLNIYLEHNVRDRVKAKSLPVSLKPRSQEVSFEIPLPREELGYALVAEYVSADGADRSEAAEFCNIAANFQRVAMFGSGLATRDVVLDEETIRRGLAKARADYFNATEYFAWAEDDMVEMSPEADFWSSGQTNYRMHKETIQRQIRLAHEQGFAVATYGKFIMSGLQGWETAYDYPYDHRGQYYYPVGMWEGVNVLELDRRRDGDFCIYSKSPSVPGNAFRNWWSTFLPINPDPTPRMARIAAEEVVRSIAMFGWDAIRWDGHPRGAGWAQCGSSGNYQAWAARQTQSLVRYFKDIVAAKYPDFRHGYNYLLIQRDKGYDWAVEDFELDELCRGGGLLMNESIGNASAGWTFAQIARNLQVEGDLCRERGGYYLGISFAMSPRDVIIESALWAAAGCRPYNPAMSREIRRYCTRYSQYTFDENLRRLAAPEKVLAPLAKTRLWWQPFVYETPLVAGKRQLVVNLLNIPVEVKRPNNRDGKPRPEWDMPEGTEPVGFALTLPAGLRATGVNLIDPQTLEVTPLALADQRFEVPSVAAWQVAVIDLAVDAGAPSLAALYGPPKTFGVPRPGGKPEDRKPEVVLVPAATIEEVNQRMGALAPDSAVKGAKDRAALEALTGVARDQALLARRQTPEALAKEWWKGAALPADLALKDKRPDFGDLAPRRNGRFDIFYGRGAMDYRIKLPLAFARLDRFQVHDAWLWGAVRHGPGMGLGGNVPGDRYGEFDLLVFTGIPHCAVGVQNCYALVDYVKAGGAVFFTGGEYAFGKGGYMHTVLERELLPLQCTGVVDTVYPEKPQAFEPGRDFGELGVTLDFAAKPVYWVRNEVVLKPGAKIFLASGDRPILVGWQLGKGRVACLLVDHRGKSEAGVVAFFDWPDWPRLVEAAVRWLAPEAGRSAPAATGTDAQTKAILSQFQGAGMDDVLDILDRPRAGLSLPATGSSSSRPLAGEALKQRLALIDRALAVGGAEIAAALATQLAAVENLPLDTRLRVFALLARQRPASASAAGRQALRSRQPTVQGSGCVLLAVAGDREFVRQFASLRAIPGDVDVEKQARLRDLALGLTLYPKPDLVEEVRRRVEDWNQQEAATRAAFAKVCGPDTAMLETTPFLDADALLQRLACLAYLSRHEPQTFAPAFLHEWLRSRQYIDYCWRTSAFMISQDKLTGARAAGVSGMWRSVVDRFSALQGLTRPDVDALLANRPAEAGAALGQARFTLERQAVVNLLGDLDRAQAAEVLAGLKQARHPDLAAFARARAAAAEK